LGSTVLLAVPLVLIGLLIEQGVERTKGLAADALRQASHASVAAQDASIASAKLRSDFERFADSLDSDGGATPKSALDERTALVGLLGELSRLRLAAITGLRAPVQESHSVVRIWRKQTGDPLVTVEGHDGNGVTVTAWWSSGLALSDVVRELSGALMERGTALSPRQLAAAIEAWATTARELIVASASNVPVTGVIDKLADGWYVTEAGLVDVSTGRLVEVPRLLANDAPEAQWLDGTQVPDAVWVYASAVHRGRQTRPLDAV
jgi:hypothetical protein